MTTEQKMLATQVLAVLGDYLEDIPMQRTAKMKRNLVVSSIRSYDSHMIDTADLEAMEQQIKIQQLFRQWCEETFKNK